MHASSTLSAAPDYSRLHHFTSGSMNSLLSAATAPVPSSTKPISCPPTPSHSQHQQQHYCPHCSPNKSHSFMTPNHIPAHHHHHHHTHMSHGNHMTTGVSGYVVSSSPTKNISHSPSVQATIPAGSGHVSPSPSFVTSYKPGPSPSTTVAGFIDHGCSLSESSFTESCANFHREPTTLQSNV